jgi:hypothetical protein
VQGPPGFTTAFLGTEPAGEALRVTDPASEALVPAGPVPAGWVAVTGHLEVAADATNLQIIHEVSCYLMASSAGELAGGGQVLAAFFEDEPISPGQTFERTIFEVVQVPEGSPFVNIQCDAAEFDAEFDLVAPQRLRLLVMPVDQGFVGIES